MRSPLIALMIATGCASVAHAQGYDIYGGADVNTQTISHCGYLPTHNVIYTTTPVVTKLVQEKLAAGGYYHGAIDGKFGPQSKAATRRYQAEHNLAVDGIVGINTSQNLAYFTHQSPNERRCWRLASADFR